MRIHHLAFRTRDLARLEAFYVEVLGFAVRSRQSGRSVWLDAGDAIVMLELAEADEPRVHEGSRELVAFAVDEAARARGAKSLAAANVPIEAHTAFTIYFRDPDGRRIALSHYPLEP